MKKKDAELIQRTLNGDQIAFTALVEKYQKGVHALIWQKIGDFHIAQEITQDTFLRAYQKLGDLKNHNMFSGWLYVIATNMCKDWLRKKQIPMQSIETVDSHEVEQMAYAEYLEQQREEDVDETRRNFVRDLLKKLPESERTVMTLYYLGDMPCESIGEFLGVSSNTVRSRLSRARNRLKKNVDIINGNLNSFQLPTQMTKNIMKEISRVNPVIPSSSKPLTPLAISAASAILMVLLMGFGTQRLYSIQKPYSLNAVSEQMIEISEAHLLMDTPAKLSVRNPVGRSNIAGKNVGVGQNPEEDLFASAEVVETEESKNKPQWIQTKGPEGGRVSKLFRSTRGDVYAGVQNNLYRLTDDGTKWQLINTLKDTTSIDTYIGTIWEHVTERQDTLYVATGKEILTSTDRGHTWNSLCVCPEGQLVGMVITDGIDGEQSDMTIYLAFKTSVFRSENNGKSWQRLIKGLSKRKVNAIAVFDNTVFVGTNKGLYRLNSDSWDQLSFHKEDKQSESYDISILLRTKKSIYAIGHIMRDAAHAFDLLSGKEYIRNRNSHWFIYRSTDRGNSWKVITPELTPKLNYGWHAATPNGLFYIPLPNNKDGKLRSNYRIEVMNMINITASGSNILIMGGNRNIYSNNTGDTWSTVESVDAIGSAIDAVFLDEKTIYRCGTQGIHRTTDGGKSWKKFNSGLVNSVVRNIIVVNETLYANTETGLVSSTDEGDTWTTVKSDSDNFTRIIESNGNLIARNCENRPHRFLQLSTLGDNLTDITHIPDLLNTASSTTKQSDTNEVSGDWIELSGDWIEIPLHSTPYSLNPYIVEDFAITDTAYYTEFQEKIFRWDIGAVNWYDTGVEKFKFGSGTHSDTDQNKPEPLTITVASFDDSLRFSVSGKVIYVGRKDGHLLHSTDEGTTWQGVTPHLPFTVNRFKAITFVGENIYVATDKGVIRSKNGTDWDMITDVEGNPLVMLRFAADGTRLFGQSGKKVYQLDEKLDLWQVITSEIPYTINCFDVEGNTLYVGTKGRGVFRYSLDE